MRPFIFTARVKFSAEDIDNAFLKLSEHFKALIEGEDTDLIELGEMQITPEELKTDDKAYLEKVFTSK